MSSWTKCDDFETTPIWRLPHRYEREKRHDVMAHIHAYGDQCPSARAIIHWGATSCYVTDNSDLWLIRDALRLIQKRLAICIRHLATFARTHASLPCPGIYPPTTSSTDNGGKSVPPCGLTIWLLDLEEVQHRLQSLKCRSVKGTTGTQASFLQLFQGDHAKVRELEKRVAERMGFESSYAVTARPTLARSMHNRRLLERHRANPAQNSDRRASIGESQGTGRAV